MKRDLSSRMTFFYKFVFPSLWIGAFVMTTSMMFLLPQSLHGTSDIREVRLIFLVFTVFGSMFIYFTCIRLKRVELEGTSLTISNYRRTVDVPLASISSISASLLLSPEEITLRLETPSLFGTTIVFMPKARMTLGFTRHPVATELQAIVTRARNEKQ